jgi:hypothetical protein
VSSIRVLVPMLLVAACSREEPPRPTLATSATVTVPAPPPEPPPKPSASVAPPPSLPTSPSELPSSPEYRVEDREDAPRLWALAQPTYIYDLPEHSKRKLGWLRPGGSVRRAEKPVSVTRKCKEGWYRVEPRGFVCAGTETTGDPSHPLVVALGKAPARGEPLPYLYGRARGNPPFLYGKVPSMREQRATEGEGLVEHLPGASRANAVAIAGAPTPVPEVLAHGRVLPRPLNQQKSLRQGVHRGMASNRSAFAFTQVIDAGGRLFGISTEADLVALDRVRLVTPTRIHGGPVRDLPVALPNHALVRFHPNDAGKLVPEGAVDAWEPLSLTGRTEGDLVEADGDTWVAKPSLVLPKRTGFPAWVNDTDKWIDVDIGTQTLVAYEGRRAVYVAPISTGAGGIGDPETTSATVQGYFHVQTKHVTATMTGDRADVGEYELQDVPYVQYFQGGYALHAAFWHERFGHPYSHGCVNLPPRDAAWIFEWTEPNVPAAWHGMDANGTGTLVYIHG